MVDIKVKGLDELLRNLQKFDGELNGAISNAVATVAEEVKREAVFSIRESSFGELVTRYDEGGAYKHVASKRGDAPNDDTGDLVGSIKVAHNSGQIFAFIFTDLEYGFFLETVLDRPWLQPALDKNKDFFRNTLRDNLLAEISSFK